ncbi:hypothetical protein Pyn_27513 [Prunus yedoensis var. nudiflora]|uniref:F-box/LRR-repeat protein 15-like leucin rich repeat domain-containing protein n=1 Tax=Prunus yedoensis var. nudiflora TaxID=2094558 RepID=A0A314YFC4_PRUYE|nr:hypothetical protein Pyn_27513 [Prunus yedoensis var. nudiflora]
MTVLRSRKIIASTKTTPHNPKSRLKLEPSTPAKTRESPNTIQSPPPPPPTASTSTPSSQPQNPNPNPHSNSKQCSVDFGSDSTSVSGVARRRSLRLASKCPDSDQSKNLALEKSRKRSTAGREKGTCSMAEKEVKEKHREEVDDHVSNGEVGFDLFGKRVTVVGVEGGTEVMKKGLGEEVNVEVDQGERGFSGLGLSLDLGSFGANCSKEEVKKKRKLEIDINFPALEWEGEDGGSKGFLSLRSGKKVAKRGLGGGHNGALVIDLDADENGKGKLGESGFAFNGVDVVELDSDSEEERSSENAVHSSSPRGKRKLSDAMEGVAEELKDDVMASENGIDNGRRRYSIEEKGKGKLIGEVVLVNGNDEAELGVKSEVLSSVENVAASLSRKRENAALPDERQDRPRSKNLIPSLQDLCLSFLAKNADAIVSLEDVADALRHRLCQMLCDSRKMNSHFFELLVQGLPTEVRLRDCSWMTEEQFTKSFQQLDTSNLTVLQLDQCGRCVADYILHSTLARSSNCLPALTTLSLSGACRLSDVGLSALVSSAPALRSLNLSQCSLLTSSSISTLADSLGSVLRELYLNDCQGIDALLILPALKKLEHLESLKELVLTDCGKLTDSSVKVIAETCTGLCALDLVNLHKLTDLTLGYLANGCREIQTLKLCRNAFSDEAIAAFLETSGECLTELSLNNIKKVGYNTAISLAKRSRKLHTLDLSWCRNLTDEALGLIADSCLSLRLLKLFGCTQLTNTFLDGHSNPEVKIIGLKVSPILEHVNVPDPHEGPLRYSSVS